jgi:hypothetical protein
MLNAFSKELLAPAESKISLEWAVDAKQDRMHGLSKGDGGAS